MKPFTKQELKAVAIIFLVVFIAIFLNMRISLRRARDAQRKNDIGITSDALNQYFAEYSYYPPSENGEIKACKGPNFDKIIAEVKTKKQFDRGLFFQGLIACKWGKDGFNDVINEGNSPFLKTLPSDPKSANGVSYYYISNEQFYQIYTYLEGEKDEPGYNLGVAARNLPCGNKVCSYGKSYAVPIDKSIEEFEKELLQKQGGHN